jgi:hypothetical protein
VRDGHLTKAAIFFTGEDHAKISQPRHYQVGQTVKGLVIFQ